jgi:hypothetical protein
MNTQAWLWAFLGLPGLREIVLVAVVSLLLYGRSGLQVARRGRGWQRWLSPIRQTSAASAARDKARADASPTRGASRWGDRVFWSLALIAATAVAAWVVTRTLIVGAPNLSH